MKVLVIIPTFNCENQIVRVLDEFSQELINHVHLVAILDNRSVDSTKFNAIKKIKLMNNPKFCVFENEQNYNLGGSQKIGFNKAIDEGYDYTAVLHGDNQAKSTELIELINYAMKNSEVEVIMGSRFMKESTLTGYSLVRTSGNKIINKIYSVVTNKRILDLGSGLNLYKVSGLKKLKYKNCSDGLTFNMDLLLEIVSNKLITKYIPISWREEDQVSNAKIFNIGFVSLISLLKWKLGLEPQKNENIYNAKLM